MIKTRRNIYLSLLVAAGLALSLLESSIPLPIMLPGAKLGLSNVVILTTIILFGFRDAFTISLLKSILLMFLSGNVIGMLYSLAGGLLSCIVMSFAYEKLSKDKEVFSLIGVSICGAVSHNISQVTVASLVLNNMKIYSYLPYLLIISLFTGYFVGLGSIFISDKLKVNLKLIS